MRPEIIIAIICIFVLGEVPVKDQKEVVEWYPFAFSAAPDASSMFSNHDTLDLPSGKHGFLRVNKGEFRFEDGSRAKFWGTNLVYNACFPAKEEGEQLAQRLAYFGFNAVRLHHMDSSFGPRGIFEDTCPTCTPDQKKITTKLSDKQLDRLDYLIYQLKKHGIYIDINLLVSRRFTAADEVNDADKLHEAAKPVSLFDRKIIDLSKKYAFDLLHHYNPYTKCRYCCDPAVIFVEITNENSLLRAWMLDKLNGTESGPNSIGKAIPYSYQTELDLLWNKWLERKYGQPAGVIQAWSDQQSLRFPGRFSFSRLQFSKKIFHSDTEISDLRGFYTDLQTRYFEEFSSFLRNQVGVKIPITGIGGFLVPEDIETEKSTDFVAMHAYWDHPRFPNKFWDKNDFRINDNSMLLDSHLGIIGKFHEACRIKEKPCVVTEWNHCYPNRFSYETPVMLAADAGKTGCQGLFQFAFSHGWSKYPVFNSIDRYFDIMSNPQQLLLAKVASILYLNQTNDQISTTITDGIFRLNSPLVQGYSGFIREQEFVSENLHIKAHENGAVFLYSASDSGIQGLKSLILVTVGGVKNTNSGWGGDRFDWGSAPTLLRKIGVDIRLKYQTGCRMYELGSDGRRRKELKGSYGNENVTFTTTASFSPWYEIVFP